MTLYWYVLGMLVAAMFVVGVRRPNERIPLATELFICVLWPAFAAILLIGVAAMVARIIWKGDIEE
jgi:hypothetical protein